MEPPLPPPPDQLGSAYAMPSWAAGPAEEEVPDYASFWQRVAATLIDGLLFAPLIAVLVWPAISDLMDEVERMIEQGERVEVTFFDTQAFTGRWLGISLGVAAIQFVYQSVMVGLWGATVGKFALRLRVRKPDLDVVGWREALLRPLLPALGGLVGGGLLSLVDNLWMLWDRQRQTLHDKIASTIVVRT